ncbi:hypothetical protein [Eikenella sp. Marseille-P7795]|uniref:hypothetical protein n=1 Tax=Eikenella sp. Marseille-P7795 TaxID=2866577 RepID=UPI001CE46554|nr:hypothetical protein [Eikenella sp. Marseille-P7795]
MSELWQSIQPLRVANGWTIDINNLYEAPLSPDNLDWYYGEYLLCATNPHKKLCFDSSFEPEGDPDGCLVVRFFSMKKGAGKPDLEVDQFLGKFETRDKAEFIRTVERFMFTSALPEVEK